MTTNNFSQEDASCPAEGILKQLSGKWKPQIYRLALDGPLPQATSVYAPDDPRAAALEVENHAWSDIVIYLVRGTALDGQVRAFALDAARSTKAWP